MIKSSDACIVPHPPYLPDLAPDFALFPKLKMKLKGHFETVSDIHRESQVVANIIKENNFHSASEVWEKSWHSCIHSQEDYFERERSQH
jgi:hypothetical protein